MNSNLIKLMFLFLVIGGYNTKVTGQSSWSSWERLYKDSDIQIEVSFKIPKKTNCLPNSKSFKYKYQVKGANRRGKRILSWDLRYIDCNDKSKKQRITLEVGGNTHGDISSWKSAVSRDYSFMGRERKKGGYNAKLSKNTNLTSIKSVIPKNITPNYSNSGTFLHYGLGVGLEWMKINVLSTNFSSGIASNKNINFQGLGLPLELTFRPLFKEHINFGFMVSGAAGTAPSFFDKGKHTNQNGEVADENLIFLRWKYSSDIAFGLKSFKFLFNYNNSTQSIDYNSTANKSRTNEEKYIFNDKIHREDIGFGMRIGSFQNAYNNGGRIVDVLYTFTQIVDASLIDIDIKSLFNSIHGLSIVSWKPNNLKWRVDFVSANQTSPFTDLKNSSIYVGLTYNWDRFY